MSRTIELVCFDLGGVIFQMAGTWVDCCKAVGAPVKNIFTSEAGKDFARPAKAFDTGRMDDHTFANSVSDMFPDYTADQILDILDVWIAGPFPGTLELLDKILATGTMTGCLSNTNHRHWETMAEYDVIERMQHRFASHLLGMTKPDSRIYDHVSNTLEIAPDKICFFDDREENIHAALTLGWRAFLIDSHGDTASQMNWYLSRLGLFEETGSAMNSNGVHNAF